MKCMIADLIRDSGAKPFAFVPDRLMEDNFCSEVLPLGANFGDIKKKLKAS